MKKYVCDVCGYIYDEEIGDPDNGVEAGNKMGRRSGRFPLSALRSRKKMSFPK